MRLFAVLRSVLPLPLRRLGGRVLNAANILLGRIGFSRKVTPDIAVELARITRQARSPDIAVGQKRDGTPRVLFANMRGDAYLLGFETLLAHRLRMEGAQVSFLLCQDLPHCNNRSIDCVAPPEICAICFATNSRLVKAARLPLFSVRDFVGQEVYDQATKMTSSLTTQECFNFEYRGIPVGKLCEVSVARYLCRDALAEDKLATTTWRSFAAGGIVLAEAYLRMFDAHRPDILFVCSGDFFWYNVAFEIATKLGIRAVSYESSFGPGECGSGRAWVFCNRCRVSRLDFSIPWKEWRNTKLTSEEDARLDDCLKSKMKGSLYHPDPIEDRRAIFDELKLDPALPIVPLFTNLTWDSAAVGRRTAFNSLREWVEKTIRYAEDKPYQLVVRPHPAETMTFEGNQSREAVGEFLKESFLVLPSNVRIVQPQSRVSSYALLDMAPAAIVYTSTLGLEATIQGKSTIIAGNAHYAGKGFGYAPVTEREYFALMDHILELVPPSDEEIEMARRYAYLFMFRLSIPLQLFETSGQFQVSRFTVQSLGDLMPGRNPYLDLIVDGILHDKSIVLPRELSSRPKYSR